MRALLLTAAAGGLLAAPAGATTRCYGEQTYAHVCVTTPGVRSYTFCVYTGGTSCTEVSVPLVDFAGTVDVECGGYLLPSSC